MSAIHQYRRPRLRLLLSMVALAVMTGVLFGVRHYVENWVDGDFEVKVFADQSYVAQPAAICVDNHNRMFVVEAHSFVLQDLTGFKEQLSARTQSDSEQLAAKVVANWRESDQVRMLEDRNGDGKADRVTTLAAGFPLQDGVASGIAIRKNSLWVSNSPNLWRFHDVDGNGQFAEQKVLHHGFGIRRTLREHGLHGLTWGPDGKLYIAMGDRGLHVKRSAGDELFVTDGGCVLRCNPDGSELEVFATGLRNPYDLAFDKYGNLWTADNDSNGGDRARWVYIVEGGDSGWRVGYQLLPNAGPFGSEGNWDPQCDVPYRVPAVGCISRGPAGLAYYPGTGLPSKYDDGFFLCDYTGKIISLHVEPAGAGYRIRDIEETLHVAAPTDIAFGIDGALYVTDWVAENATERQGRVLRIRHPAASKKADVAQVQTLLAGGMIDRTQEELASLLAHRDMRVRSEAQFELVQRGAIGAATFAAIAANSRSQLARIHAIWGLGQCADRELAVLDTLSCLFDDQDPEICCQVAKVLGDHRYKPASSSLIKQLGHSHPRARYFAAMALGKLGCRQAGPSIICMLRDSTAGDVYLRHAGVMALAALGDAALLQTAAADPSTEVRLAALLAMRRLKSPDIATFLNDSEPRMVLEAARAIHDEPIPDCLPGLASIITRVDLTEPALARAINAHFRLGTSDAAQALVEFAHRTNVSPAMRILAIEALAGWLNEDGRDRVLGCWYPMQTRSIAPARMALQNCLPELLEDPNEQVVLAAHSAAKTLGITTPSSVLCQRVYDAAVSSSLRADALQNLVARECEGMDVLVQYALHSDDRLLRLAAIRSVPAIESPSTVDLLRSIAFGKEPDLIQQAAVEALGDCKSSDAECALAELIEQAIAGKLSPILYLELVEAVKNRGFPQLRERLEFLKSQQTNRLLGDHWVSLYGGDAQSGRDIFLYHPSAQCGRCHSVKDCEPMAGPSLVKAGQRSRRELLESILWPDAVIVSGFGQTCLQLDDGTTVMGTIEAEEHSRVRLRCSNGGCRTFEAGQIQQRSPLKSGMPGDFASKLTKHELRDVVAFLASLGI